MKRKKKPDKICDKFSFGLCSLWFLGAENHFHRNWHRNISYTSLAHCGHRISLSISFCVHILLMGCVGGDFSFYYYFINAIDFRCISTIRNRPVQKWPVIALIIITHKIYTIHTHTHNRYKCSICTFQMNDRT